MVSALFFSRITCSGLSQLPLRENSSGSMERPMWQETEASCHQPKSGPARKGACLWILGALATVWRDPKLELPSHTVETAQG